MEIRLFRGLSECPANRNIIFRLYRFSFHKPIKSRLARGRLYLPLTTYKSTAESATLRPLNSGYLFIILRNPDSILAVRLDHFYKPLCAVLDKSDFYIDEQKLIIETKTVLSNDTILKFPNINSQRSIVQLRKLKKLINKGYKVEYIFISLTSNLNQFVLNKNTEYVCLLKQCIELGMVFKIWKLSLNNSVFSLDTNPNIIFRYS